MAALARRVRTARIIAWGLVLGYGIYFCVQAIQNRRIVNEQRLLDIPIHKIHAIQQWAFGVELTIRQNDPLLDPGALNRYLSAWQKIQTRRRWPLIGAPTAYGIEADSPRVQIGEGPDARTFVIGAKNPLAKERYVFLPQKKEVALIAETMAALFFFEKIDFRKRRPFPISGEITGWQWRSASGPPWGVGRVNTSWMVVQNSTWSFPCDRRLAESMADKISGLRISDFDPVDRAMGINELGLNFPAAELTVFFSSGPPITLGLGSVNISSSTPLSVNGKIVGGIPPDWQGGWPASPDDLRRKSLVDFPLAEVAKIVSVREEATVVFERMRGKWYQQAQDRRPVARALVGRWLECLALIRVDCYSADLGKDPVTRRILLFSDQGKPLLRLQWRGPVGKTQRMSLEGEPFIFDVAPGALEGMTG